MTSRPVLDGLVACTWMTASLPHDEVTAIDRAVDAHGEDAVIVTTCQRIEVYHGQRCGCAAHQRIEGFAAAAHLVEVASGLHSAIPGEEQVLGQVRSALLAAPPPFRPLADAVLAAARSLRREAGLSADSGLLLDEALTMLGAAHGGRLLVLGAGHLGRLVARRARTLGFEVTVGARTRPTAAWFDEAQFAFVPLAELIALAPVDVIVGCLGGDAAELDPGAGLPPHRHRVDLGTPRNFTPVDGASAVTIAEMLDRSRRPGDPFVGALCERAGELLRQRLAFAGEDEASPVGRLRGEVERVRQREVARIKRLHPDLPADAVETITRSLVNRLFHLPSERLRQLDDPDLARQVADLLSPTESPADESER